jgi:hypothetical protein
MESGANSDGVTGVKTLAVTVFFSDPVNEPGAVIEPVPVDDGKPIAAIKWFAVWQPILIAITQSIADFEPFRVI